MLIFNATCKWFTDFCTMRIMVKLIALPFAVAVFSIVLFGFCTTGKKPISDPSDSSVRNVLPDDINNAMVVLKGQNGAVFYETGQEKFVL